MYIHIVAACDSQYGIALNGDIPWDNSEDLRNFKRITTSGGRTPIVVMGVKTFYSIPDACRPLAGRFNIVLSTTRKDIPGADATLDSLAAALKYCKDAKGNLNTNGHLNTDYIYVIGGAALYEEALNHPACSRVYLTQIAGDYKCDRVVPGFARVHTDEYTLSETWLGKSYVRDNTPERAYLALMNRVIDNGETKINRTGIDTRAMFAQHLRYPLSYADGTVPIIPLMTTKRVSWRLVYSELLWFLSGDTSTKFLDDNKNPIWKGNSSKEFLQSRGLPYPEGEIGPGYGFQWRNFNGEYPPSSSRKPPIDQIQTVIDNIKRDPMSRRHVITAWNPQQLDKVALPPCHFTFTFNVSGGTNIGDKKYLSCHVTMRSNDMFLGHPFNAASYGALTHMIAACTGLIAREVVISMTDCHVYTNHIDQVREQSTRAPYMFPRMSFNDTIVAAKDAGTLNIDDFTMQSIIIHDYHAHPSIKGKMAV